MKFEIYPSKYKLMPVEWRWRLKGRNGEIIAQGEAHPSPALARAAIKRVKRSFLAPIVEKK